jgi:sec-independent protein translocase protein TatC
MSADDGQPPKVPGSRQREEEARRRREQEVQERLDREIAEVESYRMPLMDHLIELRDRLMWVVGAVIVGSGIGLYYARDIFALLTEPFIRAMTESGRQHQVSGLVMNGLFEAMSVWMKVGLIAGVMLASPIVSWHVWGFVAPGLLRSERRMVGPLSIGSVLLFLAGASFCFFVILPYALPFFITILEVEPVVSADAYIGGVFWMMGAFGACFQMPIAAFFAARIGVIDHKDLLGFFRYAVVMIFVLAAVLTPGPDPVSQTLLALPMLFLYGVSIAIARFFTTKVRDAAPAVDEGTTAA